MTNLTSIKINSQNCIKQIEPITFLPKEVTQILDVVSDYHKNIVFLSSDGKLYQTQNNYQLNLKSFENLPPIKSVHSGYCHFFAMTDEEKPKVYGWGQNSFFQLGLKGTTTYSEPTLIKDISDFGIDQIHPSGYASLFLNSKTNVLYGCGINSNGQCGNQNRRVGSITKITKSQENVVKVFSGHSAHSFIIKTDRELYVFGFNYGQFGNGTNLNKPLQQEKLELDFPVDTIAKITCGCKHSTILTTEGKVYVCGLNPSTGFGSDLTTFQQYPYFKDNEILIKDLSSCYEMITFLTQDNEIWVGGNYNLKNDNKSLRKLITIKNSSPNTIKGVNQSRIIFLLNLNGNYLSQDLEKLLKSGSVSDCKIQDIPVHKKLIEIRLGKDFDHVTKYLDENCTKIEIQDLLKWVYCDQMINSKRTNEILNHFGIEKPEKNRLLKNDLKKLLFDEQTSDFKLVVKNDLEDDQDDDDDDDEEEKEEEIFVHKFILAARSGLFLNLFQNLDQNLKKVKDYSGKSLETIELLISFLYTDEIPITADIDQEFIKEEFEDIVEYYQLNPQIPLLDIFDKCSLK
ncbi:btk-binding protein-related [Anaeramoeba flamelloides]|uniref:Btk-binding protein-related n=1 Tax=Anaeramoeba flamelloides TaxID=1746091 RepID=A0AAV7ZJ90_9EUKA|nr:btk-binding protein-related [Anaeramoeba flamelloides]